ncbi:MAG: hypothetical protein DRN91_04800 [Candidatus Alkanophagales archaeon]|nr:MAG: hypothetical protein DRN91_04800 [Candidatus Alkanophagales archaeon]
MNKIAIFTWAILALFALAAIAIAGHAVYLVIIEPFLDAIDRGEFWAELVALLAMSGILVSVGLSKGGDRHG